MNGDVNMKRFISILIIFMFVVFSFYQPVVAQGVIEYHYENAFSDMIDVNPQYNDELSGMTKVDFYPYTSDFIVNHNSYTLLNEKQLDIYNAIKNSPVGTMSVTVDYPVGEFKIEELSQEFFTDIMNAVCNDLPQLFYYGGYRVSYSSTNTGYVVKIIYEICLMEVSLRVGDKIINATTTYNASTVANCWNQLQSVLNGLSFNVSNRYNFLRDVHDYLCNSIIYPDFDSEFYVADCHDAYGALVSGYAVCQGYAEAFKLICDKYKIPCIYIAGTANGGGHGWNAVQMDDGKWYFLDITWDDQTDSMYPRIYDDFFLVGSNTKDTYFGGEVFSESHIPDSNLLLPRLNYATEKYSEINHFTGFNATYNSFEKSSDKCLIRSVFDINDTNVYYNGIYIEVPNLSTNASFTVPSGENGDAENWTLVLLGDCTGDGLCNASDYSEAVNKALSERVVTSAYDMAADIDCDGYIDVIDLANIYLLSNGLSSEIEIE